MQVSAGDHFPEGAKERSLTLQPSRNCRRHVGEVRRADVQLGMRCICLLVFVLGCSESETPESPHCAILAGPELDRLFEPAARHADLARDESARDVACENLAGRLHYTAGFLEALSLTDGVALDASELWANMTEANVYCRTGDHEQLSALLERLKANLDAQLQAQRASCAD